MEFVVLARRYFQRYFILNAVLTVVLLGSLKESSAQITFTEEPEDTKVVAGDPVSLNCTASSSASFKYIWQFNKGKITSDGRRTIKNDGTLDFTKTEFSDDGEYVCVARLTDGSKIRKKSQKAILTVQSICSRPTLTISPDRSQHASGDKIEMACKCSNSRPRPAIMWSKDGSKLSDGGHISISSMQLVINKLKISDSGSYQCNASNILGTKESPAKTIQVINAARPKFENKLLSKQYATENKNYKIDCKVTGKPTPKIRWFYGSQRESLSTSSKHTLGSDGSLIINNVDDNDFAKYKCEASNFLGSVADEVTLVRAYLQSFSFTPPLNYAEIGEEFLLPCTVSGGPKPNITWKTAKGGPLPPSFTVTKDNELSNKNIKKSDSGNFTCEAKNTAGTESANVQVIAAEYPEFTKQPFATAADENSKTKLECSVSTTLPLQVTWFKNKKKVVPDSTHKINSDNALVFKKVSRIDEGAYYCTVKTDPKVIKSESAILTVNAAVKLNSYNMNHHKFNMGSEARIYCSFKGSGQITVTWQKKGQKTLGANIIPKGEKLTIKSIGMEDAGIYVCTGSNSFSNDSAEVNVSVYIYPKFVVTPNNVTAEEFGSFWVHCNATGYPKPKITFSKEALGGDELPPRFHQYENGSMHVERILAGDRGNYYCIAANIANLNQVTFSLRVIIPPEVESGSKASKMGRTIAIAVGCAAAYIVLVVGLMIYCKRRRAKQQKKAEQLAMDGDADNCEVDPEMPLQPINGKPANYNKMEFPRHDLEALRTLGNGSYGRAFLSRASGIKDGERETMVVVKSLMSTDDIQREDFWRELNALIKMDNPHIVALLGVCRDIAPQYMIFEYLEKGDTKQYLLSCYENGRSTLTSSQKLSLCSNVVSGMAYLSSNNFIHKDVAARNCMVTKDLQVKIGFLSLSYDLYSSEYYRFNNMLIPLRWMAPEAIFNDEFSEKSDVWSYGVLVWEIYTMGQTPFEDRSDEEVLKCIKEDLRLSKPDNCPDTMANVMKKCWESSPDDRPSFEKLYAEISEIAVDTHL